MSRYDIATGKLEQIERDQKYMLEFNSEMRILLNVSKDRYITAFVRNDNDLFYAVLMGHVGEHNYGVWKMIASDNKGFETYKESCNEFREALPAECRGIRILPQ